MLKKKAQSTAEYAILIALVLGALLAMQTYIKRGLQGRYAGATNRFTYNLSHDPNWAAINGAAVNPDDPKYQQWEPGFVSAKSTRQVLEGTQTTESMELGGKVKRNITENTTQAGGQDPDFRVYGY